MNPIHSRLAGSRSSGLLPPICNNDTASTSGLSSPSSSKSADAAWSKYHTKCLIKQSDHLDWFSAKNNKKNLGGESQQNRTRSLASFKEVEEQENVFKYLENNKDFLENYVSNYIPQEILEKWLLNKLDYESINMSVLNNRQSLSHKFKEASSRKSFFMNIIRILRIDPTEHAVLWEMAKCMAVSVGVDAYTVYKLYPDHSTFVQFFAFDQTKDPYDQPVPKNLICAGPDQAANVLEVAKIGDCQRLSRWENPLRFPDCPQSLLRAFKINNVKTANHVMYQPILSSSGKTAYVIEMWRVRDRFKETEQEISSNFVIWGGLALYYCNLYLDKKREQNMSDFLLDVVKAIFEEMVSLDQLIKRILEFAQRLVNADRASLFLVDYRNSELVSTVFDLKFEQGLDRDIEKKEIRMPINRGIAGHVALSGEKMNIPDAYSDYRFNRDVDEATGYKTVNILCMPIKVEGRVIGVVQMVNKRGDTSFSHEDEAAFEIFSTFFGLALHHARLYDKIMRKEQKYRVALEVLSYHNTCKESEVQAMLADNQPMSVNLDDFYMDPYKFDEFEKCKSVIQMFNDLFDMSEFDIATLTRFALTVKKNYRSVPYHNFDHGWTVAHSMYVILKNDSKRRFNNKMRLALFVACLCHDLDHRGYTNKYMSETASPLASMYTTSTLEHHHFNITVTILQQDGHNIFSHITSEEYKEILGYIKHCILATDLAAFFPNLNKIKKLCGSDNTQFDWESPCNRELAMAISMTAADLSASAKPWEIQIKTVKVIFEEFYDQGDKERAAGMNPIPMMDRNKPDEQPASQVGFLSQICIPCYDVLNNILPNTKPMYAMALNNLDRWRSRVEKVRSKSENTKQDEVKNNAVVALESDNINMEPKASTSKSDIVNNCDKFTRVFDVKTSRMALKTFISEAKNKLVTWVEDEEFEQETVVMKNNIWNNIDGLTWIEEENELLEED